MAQLIYSAIASLDEFVADRNGNFDWAAPDEELHAFVNDLERRIGTHLLGRRMYEVLSFWESPQLLRDPSAVTRAYAEIWRTADKIVYSTTLADVSTARTRLERVFDPDAIGTMKVSAERDLAIGGPELAAHAFRAGLVDELHLFLHPIIVGGGTRALPLDVRMHLELMQQRKFHSGVVYLAYRLMASG